jgi:hypothetical protein
MARSDTQLHYQPSNLSSATSSIASFLTTMSRSLAILLALVPSIDGHGYLKTPRSRNLYAYQERDWEDGGGSSPYPEDCEFM